MAGEDGWLTAAITLPESDRWQTYGFWVYAVNAATPTIPAAAEDYSTVWNDAVAAAYEGDENGTGDLDTARTTNPVLEERALTAPKAPTAVTADTTDKTGELLVTWNSSTDPGSATELLTTVTEYRIYAVEGELAEDAEPYVTLDMDDPQGGWEMEIVDGQIVYSYTLSGLDDGTAYSVYIKAVNANDDLTGENKSLGTSPASSPAAVGTPRRVPDRLTGVSALSAKGNQAALTWNTPERPDEGTDPTGGSAIIAYEVDIYEKSGEGWSEAPASTARFELVENRWTLTESTGSATVSTPVFNGTEKTASVTASGTAYKLAVQAENAAGAGEWAETEIRTLHAPGQVKDLTVTPGAKTLTVTWTAPDDAGADGTNLTGDRAEVSSYMVAYKRADSTGRFDYSMIGAKEGTISWEQGSLVNGVSYILQVRACYGEVGYQNGQYVADGVESFLGEVTAETATPYTTAYSAVLTGVQTGDKLVTIDAIQAPASATGNQAGDPGDGGDQITAYELWVQPVEEHEEQPDGDYTPVGGPVKKATISVDATAAGDAAAELVNVPDLENGSKDDPARGNYLVYVKAVNAAGAGAESNRIFVRVGMPLAPTGLSAALDDDKYVVADYNAAVSNGTAIEKYIIYAGREEDGSDAQMVNEGVDGVRGTFRGSRNGEKLWVFVQAYNGVGYSPLSEGTCVTVGAPTTPVLGEVVTGSTDATFTWSASRDNGNRFLRFNLYITDVTGGAPLETVRIASSDGAAGTTTQTLTTGHTYEACITAENVAGESPRSETVRFAVGATRAPAIDSITSLGGALDVAFTVPDGTAGVTGYHVYVNGAEHQDVTAIESGDGLVHLRAGGLTNGMTYSVQVSTQNQNGESPKSTARQGTPVTSAGAVQGVKASALSGRSLQVSWDGVEHTGGSPVVGYRVNLYNAQGERVDATGNLGMVTGLTLSGESLAGGTELTIDTGYAVTVQAITRINGQEVPGAESAAARARTFNVPGAPTVTSITSENNGADYQTVTVNWDAPEDNGGAPIQGYLLYLNGIPYNGPDGISGNNELYPAAANRVVVHRDGKADYEYTSVSPAGRYSVKIMATNAAGGYAYTEVEVTVGGPTAPDVTSATASERAVLVTWNEAQATSGDAPVTGYHLYFNDTLVELSNEELAGNLSYRFTPEAGLLPGVAYTIQVAAASANGEGLKSEPYGPVRPWDTPVGAAITGMLPGTGAFQFRFADAACLGLDGTPTYQVMVKTAEEEGYTPLDSGDYTLSGGLVSVRTRNGAALQNGPVYSVYLAAAFNEDVKVDGNVATVTCGLPDAPELLEVTPGNQTFTVRFGPARSGAPAATEYHVIVADSAGNTYLSTGAATSAESPYTVVAAEEGTEYYSVTFSRMTNATQYTVKVRAKNGAGESAAYSEEMKVTPGTVTPPVIQNAYSADSQVTLQWLASSDSSVYVYYVYQDGVKVREVGGTSVEITGLTNGTSYTFRVSARNGVGESEKSIPVTLAPGSKPGDVTGASAALAGVEAEGQSLTLSWTAPEDRGGLDVTYLVSGTGIAGTTETVATSLTVTGLPKDTECAYTILVKNDAGTSAGVSLRARTAREPGKPTINSALGYNNQFKITWEAPEDGGSPVTGYNVYINGHKVNAAVIPADADHYIYDGANPDVPLRPSTSVLYAISVKAVNAVGEGLGNVTNSAYLGILDATAPDAPTISAVTPISSGRLTVAWRTPAYNGNSEILGYSVYYCAKDAYQSEADLVQYGGELGQEAHSLVVEGLTDGEAYIFAVKARNAEGTSDFSRTAEGVPQNYAAPAAPVIASYENNTAMTRMTLRWSYAPPEGAAVLDTTFRVYVGVGSTSAQAEVEYIDGTANYAAAITGLSAGIGHRIRVAATSYLADGTEVGTTYSEYITAKTNLNQRPADGGELMYGDANMDGIEDNPEALTGPSAPQNVGLKPVGATVKVTWAAPETAGTGGVVQGYTLYINTGNTGLLTAADLGVTRPDGSVFNKDGDTYSYTFQGETNASYTVQVMATNSKGLPGEKSPAMVLYLTPSYPAPEIKSAAVAAPESEGADAGVRVQLEWETPDKSQKPVGYMLYVNGANMTPIVDGRVDTSALIQDTAADSADPNAVNSYTYTEARPGTVYFFRLSAWYGESEDAESRQSAAAVVDTTVTVDPPAQVTGLTAANAGEGQHLISWAALEGDELTYNVYVDGRSAGNSREAYYRMSVEAEKVYTVEVSASNSGGEGPKSAPLVFSTAAVQPADGPTGLTVVAGPYDRDMTITWNAVEAPEAPAAYDDVSGEEAQAPTEDEPSAAPAPDGETDGESAPEAEAGESVTIPELPVPLAALSGVTYTVRILLDGGVYVLTEGLAGVSCSVENIASVSVTDSAGQPDVLDLRDKEFVVQVLAVVDGVESLPSAAAASTVYDVPGAPADFTATVPEDLTADLTAVEINLAWTAPEVTGGLEVPIVEYRLYVDAETEQYTAIDSSAVSHTFTGELGHDYSFRLTAVNAKGESVAAQATASTRLQPVPVAPDAPVVTGYLSDGLNVRLLWTGPVENQGEAITHYILLLNGEQVRQTDEAGEPVTDVDGNPVYVEIPVNDQDSYSFIIPELTSGAHDVEVKAMADTLVGNGHAVKVNPAYNRIAEDGDLSAATQPAAGATLDQDMDGKADGNGEGINVTIQGTVSLSGSTTGNVKITVYLESDANEQLGTATVMASGSTVSLSVDTPMPAADATLKIVIEKLNHTSVTITGVPASAAQNGIIDLDSLEKKFELIAGDTNGDGKITGDDMEKVKSNFGRAGEEIDGDTNSDGKVNGDDSEVIKRYYGKLAQTFAWQ